MSNKAALLAVPLAILAVLAFVPMADLSAEEGDAVQVIDDSGVTKSSEDSNERNYVFEGAMVFIVLLAVLGYLHVKYHSKKKQ